MLRFLRMTNALLSNHPSSTPTDCHPRSLTKNLHGFPFHICSEGLHVQTYIWQIGSQCRRESPILDSSRFAGISRVFRIKLPHRDNGTFIAQATLARVLYRLFVGVEKWITCPLITGPADCTSRMAHSIEIVVVTITLDHGVTNAWKYSSCARCSPLRNLFHNDHPRSNRPDLRSAVDSSDKPAILRRRDRTPCLFDRITCLAKPSGRELDRV